MHFGATLFGLANHLHGGHFNAVDGLGDAVLHKTTAELHHMHFAVAANGEAQHFGQRIDTRDAYAMQAARYFVTVLVELAAGVEFGQGDFSGRALGLVLVVHLHAGGNATAVVDHADGVVGMDGDQNVVAMACQRLVNGVVHYFKDQVVQAGAVRRVADVHAGALAHGFQAFKNLDRAFAVGFGSTRLVGVDGGLEVGTICAAFTGVHRLGAVFSRYGGFVFFGHGSLLSLN